MSRTSDVGPKMTSEANRWQRVRHVFQATLERPDADRPRFLREACTGDSDLRREVESLLDAHLAAAGHFMESPAIEDRSAATRPIAIGTRIGTYEILGPLGEGGMGVVYRARDRTLNRQVALKVLPPEFALDRDRLARFEREVQAVAALNHPNIVTIYSVETVEGLPCFAMELVEGTTLSQTIRRHGLNVSEILKIAVPLADAVSAAHQRGITHRDLKPTNIMVTRDGHLKVLDFGLAKLLEPESAGGLPAMPPIDELTGEGRIIGTVAYMSPEQADGKPVDHRSDIFSLGIILYELATGEPPFTGDSNLTLLSSILKDTPSPITAINPSMPHELARIVRHCLAKDPTRRYQTAADLRNELEELQADLASGELGGEDANRLSQPWRRWLGRARAWWLGVCASALVAALLAWSAARYIGRATPELAVSRFEIGTPPTTDPFSFALSPDGRQLVFVATSDGAPKLWLRPLDQTVAQPLAGTEDASYPFWAPDGRALGFFAEGKLKRLDLGGGVPQVLADAPFPFGGSWNRDGVILFAPNSQTALFRVPATGGMPTVATERKAGAGSHRFPVFLPDGRRFVFFVRYDEDGVYLGALDAGGTRRILAADAAAAYAPPGYLLILRQGALLAVPFDASSGTASDDPRPVAPAVGEISRRGAFSVSTTGLLAHRSGTAGRRQLVWFDRTGAIAGKVGSPDDLGLADPDLASDGRRVAIARLGRSTVDVWLVDTARGVPNRFTFDGRSTLPLWAPDGSRVIFGKYNSAGVDDLFERRADGAGGERLVLATSESKIPADWSPDGRVLLYRSQGAKTAGDLWALPLTGGGKPFPVVQTPFNEDEGQFSPDGRWIAYRSDESGREEIYVQSFSGAAGKQQVSTEGGSQPRWRRNGKEFVLPCTGQQVDDGVDRSGVRRAHGGGRCACDALKIRIAGSDQPKQHTRWPPMASAS